MAIRDHINQVPKLRGTVTTVDPSQRLIEVVTTDGGIKRLAVFDVPSQFTWPVQGEQWTIYEENGYWYLGNKFLDPEEDAIFMAMQPGDNRTPGVFKTQLNDPNKSFFLLEHHLNNMNPVVSLSESPKYFIFGKDATASATSIYNLVGSADFPTTGGVIWCSDTHELIKYTTWAYDIPSGMNLFTGCTRGYGGTVARPHTALTYGPNGYLPFEKCWKLLDPIFPDVVYGVDLNRTAISLPTNMGSLDSSHIKVTIVG